MNIDRELVFSCPEECGQIAVTCSLRMILENQSLVCDACGCEFQGTLAPAWLASATHRPLPPEDRQLLQNMRLLFAYLYAGGSCPPATVLEDLLLSYPQYWQLFPAKDIPVKAVVKLLATEATFRQRFDISTLTPDSWLELLTLKPEYSAKCPWEAVSRFVVNSHLQLPSAWAQNQEAIFAQSGLQDDKRFSSQTMQETCTLANPIAFAWKMGWAKHLNWQAFSAEEIFSAFKFFPELLGYYPFSDSNVDNVDWNRFNAQDWARAINFIPNHSPVKKIYALISGNGVEKILQEKPAWARYCSWSKIPASEWVQILVHSPQWASHCPWKIFTCSEWLELFKLDQAYAQHCDWNKFTSSDWVAILKQYPGFSQHCPWEKIAFDDWKPILTNDLLDKAAYEAKGSQANWPRSFDYDSLRHPKYLAIFSLLHATGVMEALSRHPHLEDRYLDWNKLDGEEWLHCLAKDPQYARKFTKAHWQKILNYIKTLPEEKQHSVSNFNLYLWERRQEVLDAAHLQELVNLPPDDFYTLVDYMDWEWNSRFSWASLSKEQVLRLARKHPEFLEKYGLERISKEDFKRLLMTSPAFADYCLEKVRGNDEAARFFKHSLNHETIADLLTQHPDQYPKFQNLFSLNLKERSHFQYYLIEPLRRQAAFHRLFVTQMAMFLLGWLFLYFGDCGYRAFSGEYPQATRWTIGAYAVFALVWSLIQAKLHEYCGAGGMSRFLGITQGILGVALFGYSFFLTSLTRSNWLAALAISAAYMLFMLYSHHHYAHKLEHTILIGEGRTFWAVKLSRVSVTPPNYRREMFLHITTLILLQLLLVTVILNILHPYSVDGNLALAKSLATAKTPFASAASYFHAQAVKKDKKLKEDLSDFHTNLQHFHYDQAEILRDKICARYPEYYSRLTPQLQECREKVQKEALRQAELAFQKGEYHKTLDFLSKADQENPSVQYMQGHIFLHCQELADYAKARSWLERAAAQNDFLASYDLGTIFETGKGADIDIPLAISYYEKAFQGNVKEALPKLAKLCATMPDLDKAINYNQLLAAKDDPEAMLQLAELTLRRDDYQDRDWPSVEALYRRAANLRHIPAIEKMASLYHQGKIAEVDVFEQEKCYQWLAAKGDAEYQLALGELYAGDKLTNQAEALAWFQAAAAKGSIKARRRLAQCYEKGLGVEKDMSIAAYHYRIAAEQGDQESQVWIQRYDKQMRHATEKLAEEEARRQAEEQLRAKLLARQHWLKICFADFACCGENLTARIGSLTPAIFQERLPALTDIVIMHAVIAKAEIAGIGNFARLSNIPLDHLLDRTRPPVGLNALDRELTRMLHKRNAQILSALLGMDVSAAQMRSLPLDTVIMESLKKKHPVYKIGDHVKLDCFVQVSRKNIALRGHLLQIAPGYFRVGGQTCYAQDFSRDVLRRFYPTINKQMMEEEYALIQSQYQEQSQQFSLEDLHNTMTRAFMPKIQGDSGQNVYDVNYWEPVFDLRARIAAKLRQCFEIYLKKAK